MLTLVALLWFLPNALACEVDTAAVGKWNQDSNGENISIDANGALFHSKFGAGDIRRIAGERHEITYYSAKTGKPLRTCTVVIRKSGGRIGMANPTKDPNCPVGMLSRVFEPKESGSAGEKRSTSNAKATGNSENWELDAIDKATSSAN